MEFRIGKRFWRFHGGLQLRHWKKMSIERPLEFAGVPEQLILSLDQHSSPPCEPIVSPGQRVLKGEVIAEPAAGLGTYLHAPASGVVDAIEDHPVPHISGLSTKCIVIRPSPSDEGDAFMSPLPDWRERDAQDLWERVRRAGIAGLGGAAFPTHAKLRAGEEVGVRYLIVNGAECEPYISCDEMLMRHQPERLLLGTLMLARVLQPHQTVVAIEDQMGAVEDILEETIRRLGLEGIDVVKIPTLYPEGGERQLIQVLTGQEVPATGYPVDMGIVMQNVATAAAVHDAVLEGKPLLSRIVSLTGRGLAAPRNVEALIGTPLRHLVDVAGGYTDAVSRLVMGGPMMGMALPSDEVPTVKGSNCILALTRQDTDLHHPELPCIRCGECARVCPAQLLPQQLYWHIQAKEYERSEEFDLFDCIECGCCAYVCPSQLPLVDYYRHGKAELRARDADRRRAEQARRRYENRNERLERQQRERQERLRRKKEALKAGRPKAAIQAAVERARAKKSGEDSGEGT